MVSPGLFYPKFTVKSVPTSLVKEVSTESYLAVYVDAVSAGVILPTGFVPLQKSNYFGFSN